MSYVLLWQPSECVYLINDYVMLFSENKHDDDGILLRNSVVVTAVMFGLPASVVDCAVVEGGAVVDGGTSVAGK